MAHAQTPRHAMPMGAAATTPAAPVEALGFVRALNPKAGTVTIAHEAIPALNQPAMTMPFKVADPALLKDVAVGAKVRFQILGAQIVGLTVL